MPEQFTTKKSKWPWTPLVFGGLLLCIMAVVIIATPVSPTMRAIRSVHGEMTDVETTTPLFVRMVQNLQALFGRQTVKDLYLGPRDKGVFPGQRVYNEELTDEAILQMDLSELGVIRFVDMSGPHVTDRGFAHIVGNPCVSNLTCRDTQVTDVGLVALARNRNLRSLNLTGNNITDAGMASVVQVPGLHSIHLGDTRITDQAIKDLAAGCTRLAHLDVASTALTTSGLEQLQNIRGLSSIGLDATQLTDETVPLLQPIIGTHLTIWTCTSRRKMELLKQGVMTPSPIDDALMARVAQLKGFQHLWLRASTPGDSVTFTTAGVNHLIAMPQLKSLWIDDLEVPPAVIREIRVRMPTLHFNVNGKEM